MGQSVWKENKKWICLVIMIMVLQVLVASYFCIQKQGFHYDEYYSYYSSNVTYGLVPTDREWKDVAEIISEFQVQKGEGFRYGLVKTMQSFDVHPPLYYMILHTICSLFPGMFSKWFGLGLNLFLFILCYFLLARIAYVVFRGNRPLVVCTCLLYGCQAGVLSGITFIRMYVLLTMWCLLVTLWHERAWKERLRMTPINSFFLILLVMAGFLTHYYFAVFMLFTAAFTCLYQWIVEKNLKGSICYGIAVCTGMGMAVVWYPSCLSHIFRGYRGMEATDAFFDLGNTLVRLDFFTDLMNQSVFGGSFWILFLLLIMLLLGIWGSITEKKEKIKLFLKEHTGLFHIAVVTAGYFLVVAKTALLNAEEANRYELPVYGFIMLLFLAGFSVLSQWISQRIREGTVEKKVWKISWLFFIGSIFCSQLLALKEGKVQFLYPEDRENIQWAREHEKAAILYLYNPDNTWMIWDEAEELMQYEQIYFVSLADISPVTDEVLLKEEEIYVYASRREEAESMMEHLVQENPRWETKEKIRELLYCDLYHLY